MLTFQIARRNVLVRVFAIGSRKGRSTSTGRFSCQWIFLAHPIIDAKDVFHEIANLYLDMLTVLAGKPLAIRPHRVGTIAMRLTRRRRICIVQRSGNTFTPMITHMVTLAIGARLVNNIAIQTRKPLRAVAMKPLDGRVVMNVQRLALRIRRLAFKGGNAYFANGTILTHQGTFRIIRNHIVAIISNGIRVIVVQSGIIVLSFYKQQLTE
jgi:hypothetical protein